MPFAEGMGEGNQGEVTWHQAGSLSLTERSEEYTKMAERNLNHTQMAIPKDCEAIHVFMDGELFDEFVKIGLVPLLDGRKLPKYDWLDFQMPVFIGYEPGVDPQHPKGPDIGARLRAARSAEAHSNDRSANNHAQSPNQGPDSGQK